METVKNLHKLLEIADLAGMVEDLMNPTTMSTLSPASWSGMRITLRNIKESILTAHDKLASDMVARSREESVGASIATTSTDSALAKSVEKVRDDNSKAAAALSINGAAMNINAAALAAEKKPDLRKIVEQKLNS